MLGINGHDKRQGLLENRPTSGLATRMLAHTLQAADSWLVGKWRPIVARRPLLRLGVRLDADPIVDCAAQLLFAPEVTLRRLDRDMTEQELDLI